MKRQLILIVCIFLVFSTVAAAADYVLIMNKANTVTTASQTDIKNFYLGKKTRWSNGAPVTVYTQANSSVHRAFMRQMVKKSEQQYKTYWKKMLFTGTGLPPKDFDSVEQIKQAVAAKEGALGYIPATALDVTVAALTVN